MPHKTWSDEWKRTNPDIVLYLPQEENGYDAVNQHFLVKKSPTGAWLAFWTSGADEGQANQSMRFSRSTDRGATWSKPIVIDGPQANQSPGCFKAPDQHEGTWSPTPIGDKAGKEHAGIASYGFPIIAPDLNRIYCFYFKCTGKADLVYAMGGAFMVRYSDDDGLTWSDEAFEISLEKTLGDNPDPEIPPTWIIWQIPYVTSRGEVIAPFTCWNSKKSSAGIGSESHFLLFDNVLTEPDPSKLTTTTLTSGHRGLRMPSAMDTHISFCEEPAIVELSDGRFFCVMRTDTGYIVYSLSDDQCRTWRPPAPLYRDRDGDLMLNPVSSCPIYKLKDGRYILVYYNNTGDANGGYFPCGYDCVRKNRYPAFISVGHEDPGNKERPIRFGPPKMFADTAGIGIGPGGRTEVATYPSLLEDGDDRVLFYPDRKHFLLGRQLTDEWLADCEP